MTRNIKKILTSFFACCLLLTSTTQAFGDCCCDPCNCECECFCQFPNYNPCCTGVGDGASLILEFIWWKPCFNDLDYAVKFDTASVGDNRSCGSYLYPPHQFSPGFRVELAMDKVWCNWDLMAHYTWVQEKAHNEQTNDTGLLASTLFHGGFNGDVADPDTLNASHFYQYQTFDILLGQDCCISHCHYFTTYFGLQGLKLDQTWKSDASEVVGQFTNNLDLRWDSTYEGLGLALGVEYDYRISCIEFYTDARLAFVRGNNVSKYDLTRVVGGTGPVTTNVIFKTDDPSCVPGVHLRAGINYVYEYCNKEFIFTIGYEFLNWFNMPRIRRFTDTESDIGISSSPNGSRIGFHGLNIGVGVKI